MSKKWIAATVAFRADKEAGAWAADAVCDLFYDFGLKGVVIDDTVKPNDIGQVAGKVTGYFPKDRSVFETLSCLRKMVDDLGRRVPFSATVTTSELDEQDWAHFWKAHFYPEKIGQHLVIKPSWRDYAASQDEIVIEIDPGMAFGTGTHPTTRMCLRMLEDRLRKGDNFLDIGTGTGVLAIAARKLGAAFVLGVDNDPVAVAIAEANLRLNNLSFPLAQVISGDLTQNIDRVFDFATANIQTETVMALIPEAKKILAAGGLLICSGIVRQKLASVKAALLDQGFIIKEILYEEDWVCLAASAPE